MSGVIARRLAAIEKHLGTLPAVDCSPDAKAFTDAILRLADRFGDVDARIDAVERRIRFSPAERLAWALRFGRPEEFDQALADAAEMVA